MKESRPAPAVKPGALATLQARGFVQQCSDVEALGRLLDSEPVTFYVGIDPTATSMHVGHMVPLFAMAHLAAHGHNPIVVVGGGTARIGDPSGKTEMRKILSIEDIDRNAQAMGAQVQRVLDVANAKFTMVNNASWLADLNYIDFLRDIGRHFSVNRMLSFETYKMRLETGLSFIEFNYQLLQSYDFLVLNQRYGCRLQIGGDDQWGNIIAGADLIRRVESREAYALTFPLVTRADGKKMGKSEKGAVFLDPALYSPYDFFQYWRNVPDADVRKLMLFYTFLPVDEVERLVAGEGAELNAAKERLAYEITSIVHGIEEADKARDAARALFAGAAAGTEAAVPGAEIADAEVAAGINAVELFVRSELASSRGEARRLIEQGGARINDRQVPGIETTVDATWVEDGQLLLRAGKKRYYRFRVV